MSHWNAVYNGQGDLVENARRPADPRNQAERWQQTNPRQAHKCAPLPEEKPVEGFHMPDRNQYPIYNPFDSEPAYFTPIPTTPCQPKK